MEESEDTHHGSTRRLCAEWIVILVQITNSSHRLRQPSNVQSTHFGNLAFLHLLVQTTKSSHRLCESSKTRWTRLRRFMFLHVLVQHSRLGCKRVPGDLCVNRIINKASCARLGSSVWVRCSFLVDLWL